MAGDITDTSVLWNLNDATGRKPGGASAAIPGDNITIVAAAGAPSGAPNGSPLYVDTATNKLYAYVSPNWIAISGANT